jgi:serine/threonine protein kinase/Tfp pilus assembly protein PilF
MSRTDEAPELFPDVNAAGALRAAFESRPRSRSAMPHSARTDAQPSAALASIAAPRESSRAYDLEVEIARGGMGVVLKAHDRELDRDVALKVLRDELRDEPRFVRRFLEEARVTARLDHPGIVPVHEVGRDASGRAYFAMRHVRGRDLRRIIELARADSDGWNETRALSVIQKVCEAMAYAHERGVIHRDLKPANIMVGEFGEVYVMDWGLARVIGGEDTHDLRLRDAADSRASASRARTGAPDAERDSPIMTMDGDVLGTPCYMSPEQAQGRLAELGPRSDVYSVGAMLYHLLSGEMPYVPSGTSIASRAVLMHLVQGPPRALAAIRRDVPSELIAITEKAMSREPGDRYPDMLAMAGDLRAFLEWRVVRAYETGAWAEAKKWVQRNKSLSAAMGVALVALVVGLVASLALKATSDRNSARAERNSDLASAERDKALKIASFLEDTLSGAGPSVALGRDTTMLREMMDTAVARIDKGELAAAPEAEQRLLLVIGSTLREIADYDKAEHVLRRALDTARQSSPRDDAELAKCSATLGLLLLDRGELDAAEPLLREALAIQTRLFAGDHAAIAASLENLGALCKSRGDRAGAETYLRDALAMNRRLYAGDHDQLAINLINLGVVLQSRGDLDGAEGCFTEAVAIEERLFPAGHPHAAASQDNLAALYAARGDIARAEGLHRRALEMRRRLFPGDHPDVASSINNLAATLQERGDLAGAETLFREGLAMQTRLFRGDHALVAMSLINLAGLLDSQGDVEGALSAYERGIAMQRRLNAKDSPEVVLSLHNFAVLLRGIGDLWRAERCAREALEMQRRLSPGDDAHTADLENALANILRLHGELEAAEPLYRDAIAMRARLFGPSSAEVAGISVNLAGLLALRGDLSPAEALYRDALKAYSAALPASHPSLATTRVELGLVLSREARYCEAEETLLAAADVLERGAAANAAWWRACLQRLVDNYATWETAEPNRGHAHSADSWRSKLAALESR